MTRFLAGMLFATLLYLAGWGTVEALTVAAGRALVSVAEKAQAHAESASKALQEGSK